jgi:hypothetical protein
MLPIFQVLVLFLLALAMACSVAHALELPGKLRLPQQIYLYVQSIYFPGFTFVGGIAEVVGTIAALVLAAWTPRHNVAFPLTLVAAFAMLFSELVFWFVTQPVNRRWREIHRDAGGAVSVHPTGGRAFDWIALRTRWEYSHVARAVLQLGALMALAAAIAAS